MSDRITRAMVERRLALFQLAVSERDPAAGASLSRAYVKHESGVYRVNILELGGSAEHEFSPGVLTPRELLTWLQGLEAGWGLADRLRSWDEQDIARRRSADDELEGAAAARLRWKAGESARLAEYPSRRPGGAL